MYMATNKWLEALTVYNKQYLDYNTHSRLVRDILYREELSAHILLFYEKFLFSHRILKILRFSVQNLILYIYILWSNRSLFSIAFCNVIPDLPVLYFDK